MIYLRSNRFKIVPAIPKDLYSKKSIRSPIQSRLRGELNAPVFTIVSGRHGKIEVLPGGIRVCSHNRRAYRCRCDCGSIVYLYSTEIRHREKHNLPCLSQTCTEAGIYAPWVRKEIAVRMQALQILWHRPNDTHNEWGGQVYEGGAVVNFDQGLSKMVEFLMAITTDKNWWVRKKNQHLPFMPSNIEMGNRPMKTLFSRKELTAYYAGTVLPISDVAAALGKTGEEILKMCFETNYAMI